MASSGTVNAITTTFRLKPRARDSVLVAGKMNIKSTATIEARDLSLRTIKSAVLTAYDALPVRSGGPPILYGSINTGSLENSIRIRSFRGSIVPHTGTQHVGTAAGGTMRINFFIVGA